MVVMARRGKAWHGWVRYGWVWHGGKWRASARRCRFRAGIMSSNTTIPPKFSPPVSAKLTPAEVGLHLRQIYLTINQHDQAITQVHNKIPTTTSTVAAVAATTVVSGVTSFNTASGTITFFPNL